MKTDASNSIDSISLKNAPILDHDYADIRNPMSRQPFAMPDGSDIPKAFLLSFMSDALEEHIALNGCPVIATHHSEVRDFHLYETEANGARIGLVQAPVGAPAAAMLMDRLIHSGVTAIAACGGCGVLKPISSGKILIPTTAVRDEGTSYHYARPSFEIATSELGVSCSKQILEELDVPYELCRTWTTDGFFRETPDTIRKRKEQGCMTVEMECSALAAVAEFYGAEFFEVLYSGDSLCDPEHHDDRNWLRNTSARQACFELALLSIAKLSYDCE